MLSVSCARWPQGATKPQEKAPFFPGGPQRSPRENEHYRGPAERPSEGLSRGAAAEGGWLVWLEPLKGRGAAAT